MKVNGSISPDAFALEASTEEDGYSIAVFRENITEGQEESEEKVYTYDEYHLPLKTEKGLESKIKANYDFYLLAAKGHDAWEQMNNLVKDKIS